MMARMVALTGFAPETPPATRRRVLLVLGLAVLGISSSAVIVRGMEGIGPIAIAAWRCLAAGLLLSPGIAMSLRRVSRRDLALTTVSGAFLGMHFAVWFASLFHTTVMRSTVLVALVPVWTGLLEWLWTRERPTGRYWAGVGLALLGVTWLTTDDSLGGTLAGDGMAVAAGLLWAVYFLIGREVRQRVEITAYMGLVSLAAAGFLFPAALLQGAVLTGFSPWTWGLLLLAALGPQLLGHQGSAYAVKYLPARIVSTAMLLEPVGATLLAWLLLAETPPATAALAGLVVVGGVALATAGPGAEPADD